MLSPEFAIDTSTDRKVHDFFQIIQQIGRPKKIRKGQTIIRYDTQSSFFVFIVSGIVKKSVLINDKEFVLCFAFPGDLSCNPVSLLSGTANNFSVQAITDVDVLIVELKDFQQFCSPLDYQQIINAMLVSYLKVVEERVVHSISLTAEEQYRLLLDKQPQQAKQVPLLHIAAYLGITLERLSRIRRKLRVDQEN